MKCSYLAFLVALLVAQVTASILRKDYIDDLGRHKIQIHHRETNLSAEIVANSGVCETTPGVKQYSGYLDVGKGMHMWFWFFEARQNAHTAPLATWLQGGPGAASEYAIFLENGPCKYFGPNNYTRNPYSFNEVANMLYIDQPIEAGFSHGNTSESRAVNTTQRAVPYIWKFLQLFYDTFPEYGSRSFSIFTESYGGHYGPDLARYILRQNRRSGSHYKINITSLGINNGMIHEWVQMRPTIESWRGNPYRQIANESFYKSALATFDKHCTSLGQRCILTEKRRDCKVPKDCYDLVFRPPTKIDVYDMRRLANETKEPPHKFIEYLEDPDVMKRIGARAEFVPLADELEPRFVAEDDESFPHTKDLSEVVRAGVNTLLWFGDADYICGYKGGFEVAKIVDHPGRAEFNDKSLESYKVNGKVGGVFKTAGSLSYLQVYNAGHMIMYYQPELSLQVFRQLVMGEGLHST